VDRLNGPTKYFELQFIVGISDGKAVQVKVGPLDAQVYRCDSCFTPALQPDFFKECGITGLLDSALEGYRSCAFAFGQTGAGKTFTMTGPSKGFSATDKQMGVVGRSIGYLLDKINMFRNQFPDIDPALFSMRVSCLEIYHEQVFDLFHSFSELGIEKGNGNRSNSSNGGIGGSSSSNNLIGVAERNNTAPDRRGTERETLAVREHAVEGFFVEGCRCVCVCVCVCV
jgi:hypothetical protein